MSIPIIGSNNKTLFVNDGMSARDTHKIRRLGDTDIEIRCQETGELIWRGHNKVILPGAGYLARLMFDLTNTTEVTPSYNTSLGLQNSVYEAATSLNKTFLFCVGTSGCGRENSQIFDVDYAKWIAPADMVPFRYPLSNADIDNSLRDKYFGRKAVGDRIAYYFKKFETEPVLVQQYIDGTPIDSNVYTNEKSEEIETYVEIRLAITKEDCRDFFISTTGINDARINTISLCTAWAKNFRDADDVTRVYYQDIRPITRLNFSNESLIDLSKGIDIIYHVYF